MRATGSTDILELPHRLQAMVESELAPDERIVWLGQPIPSRYARQSIPIVLFGIPWTAFAIFWTVGAGWGTWNMNGPWFVYLFPLFGLPFILIGLGMLSAPLWVFRAAGRTVYLLTDRRAVIITSTGLGGSLNVRSFEPGQLGDLQRNQSTSGAGDIIFARDWRRDSDGDRQSTNVGFLSIRNVKEVEAQIRQLVEEARLIDDQTSADE